jgi:hypothetical protein
MMPSRGREKGKGHVRGDELEKLDKKKNKRMTNIK